MEGRKQSEFGRKRGEEKLENVGLANRLITGIPSQSSSVLPAASNARRAPGKPKRSAVQDAMERAPQLAKEEAEKQQNIDDEQSRLFDIFSQRMDAIAQEASTRDRRAKIAETTRRALRQIEELSTFLGLDKFDPILANVTSLRTEDPPINLDQMMEAVLAPMYFTPADYYASSVKQIEAMHSGMGNTEGLADALDEEERILYEEAASVTSASKMLARECICSRRMDQVIETAEYAATINIRLQLTNLFSKITLGCTNMIRSMEKQLLEKERRLAELRVTNELLVDRAEQSRRDLLAMEKASAKQMEALERQMELIVQEGAGPPPQGASNPTASSTQLTRKGATGSKNAAKGLLGEMNAVFLQQRDFFARETLLLHTMKGLRSQLGYEKELAGESITEPTSKELLQSGLDTAFKMDPAVTAQDKKANAPWVQRMLKRVCDFQQSREMLRQSECRLMESFDVVPVARAPRAMQTMKEEDVQGSPAWERKYAALREAADAASRPQSEQNLNVREIVGEELAIKVEMRRCGFEATLGLPKKVTAGIENVLGCSKELMLNLDYARVSAVTKFTELVERAGGSKLKAIDLGNSSQLLMEQEVDEYLDNFRTALTLLKLAVLEELKPKPTPAPAASSASSAAANTKKVELCGELATEISNKLLLLLGTQRIAVPEITMEDGNDPLVAQMRRVDAILDAVNESKSPVRSPRRSKSRDADGSSISSSFKDKNLSRVGIMSSLVVVDVAEMLNNLRTSVALHWGNEMQESLGNAQPVAEPSWQDVLDQLRQTSDWCKKASASLSKHRTDQAAAASKAAAASELVAEAAVRKASVQLMAIAKKASSTSMKGKAAETFDGIPVVEEEPKKKSAAAPAKKEKGPKQQAPSKPVEEKESPSPSQPQHNQQPPEAAAPPPAKGTAMSRKAAKAAKEVVGSTIELACAMREIILRITNVIATKGRIVCALPEEVVEEAVHIQSQFDPAVFQTEAHGLDAVLQLMQMMTSWSDFIGEILDPSLYKPSASVHASPVDSLAALSEVNFPQFAASDGNPPTAEVVEAAHAAVGSAFSSSEVGGKPPTRGSTVQRDPKKKKNWKEDPDATAVLAPGLPSHAVATPVDEFLPSRVATRLRGSIDGLQSNEQRTGTPSTPFEAAAAGKAQASTPTTPYIDAPPPTHAQSSSEPLSPAGVLSPVLARRASSFKSFSQAASRAEASSAFPASGSRPLYRPSQEDGDDDDDDDDEAEVEVPSMAALIRRRSSLNVTAAMNPFQGKKNVMHNDDDDDDDDDGDEDYDDSEEDGEEKEVLRANVLSSVSRMYPRLPQNLLAPQKIEGVISDLAAHRRRSSLRLGAPKLILDLCLALVDVLRLKDSEVSPDLRTAAEPEKLLPAVLKALRQRQMHREPIAVRSREEAGEDEIKRLQMLLQAAETTMCQLLFDKMKAEGMDEGAAALIAVQRAKSVFMGAVADSPLLQSENIPRVETEPAGFPTFRKVNDPAAAGALPPRPERGFVGVRAEALGKSNLPSPHALANALKGIESLVEARNRAAACAAVPPEAIANAMQKLAMDLNPRERNALLNELLGASFAVRLHRAILKLLTTQVFRRIKFKAGAALKDPLADIEAAAVPNVCELLHHDLSVVTATLEVLEEDSQHAVEKIKIVFQRVKANILIARVRRAQEVLHAQAHDVAKDVQVVLLRKREERIRKDLLRLAELRDTVCNKQRKNWTTDGSRKLYPLARIGFGMDTGDALGDWSSDGGGAFASIHKTAVAPSDEYIDIFLMRMQRWFQYKRTAIRHTPQQMLQRVLGGAPSGAEIHRRDLSPPLPPVNPPEAGGGGGGAGVKLGGVSTVELSKEIAKRGGTHVVGAAPKQKVLSSLKLQHPSMQSSPVVSEKQRDHISKVVVARAGTPVSAVSAPIGNQPYNPSLWVDASMRAGRMAATPPLPAIGGSPPPTRQTVRGSSTRVGGASL